MLAEVVLDRCEARHHPLDGLAVDPPQRLRSFISGVYYYNPRVIMAAMPWEIEYTDKFDEWFDRLGEEAQEDVARRYRDLSRTRLRAPGTRT